ncbi:Rrf2 family transcriptional regulator [Hazenella sp. IB182357]|uniref:Rrf2 family transcriptional regulator n=1 Tax=Polycladospora coralii TaxID=2771432 RepID=A0A926RU81_9BACL|nr:Rrf2 family transcriptional regulator [Polycladospora coralii]MBD1372613.1 Rrf2 family transcriptional regulator [Polycladospora coralii]MBS7531280.1 Rrf2 family transcriptional regulator [Polycladospora coralii]
MSEKLTNTRWFGYAIQALVLLARHGGVCASNEMAGMLDSRSTYLRKILSFLVKAELIQAKEGREGGYSLARPADEITLADVYHAMKVEDPFTKGLMESTSDECQTAEITKQNFEQLGREIDTVICTELNRKTIADLIPSA